MIITIDGPAGSGKSTVARALAHALGFGYLDSGAMYRCVALRAIEGSADADDGAVITTLAGGLPFACEGIGESGERVFLDREDVTERIREPDVSHLSSKVAAYPGVREQLVGLQREILAKGSCVAEGRDMGTVVAPNAELKIYLFADPRVRAVRREKELKQKGLDFEIDAVEEAMIKRDNADESRDASPLKPADDAVQIDTSEMVADDAVATILKLAQERM